MAEPARRLDEALDAMRWVEVDGRFAIVGVDGPPAAEDLEDLAPPSQVVTEEDETTLLVREDRLPGLLERRPGARVERDLVWFTFQAPMGWEVVGFLARVTAALADEGVPLGAVCGFHRDHLFVPARHRDRARRVLARLFPEEAAGRGPLP
ncbi:MAG: ACT domain-containing protein [Planctomycetota bacterium]